MRSLCVAIVAAIVVSGSTVTAKAADPAQATDPDFATPISAGADAEGPSTDATNEEAVAFVRHFRAAFRCLSGPEEEYCEELLESISADTLANNWCERDDDCTAFEQLPFGQVPHRADSARSLRAKMRRFRRHCEVCALRTSPGWAPTLTEAPVCRDGRCWIEVAAPQCEQRAEEPPTHEWKELFEHGPADSETEESVLSDDELAAAIESLVALHGNDERRCKQPRRPRQTWKSTCNAEFSDENRHLRTSCTLQTEDESLTMTTDVTLANLGVVRVLDNAPPECDRKDAPTTVVVAACSETACATMTTDWDESGPLPSGFVQLGVNSAEAGEQIAAHLRHLIRRAARDVRPVDEAHP